MTNLTRCLGNLWLKRFYKDFPDLESASQDPISPEPEITSIAMDETCQFLILASASLLETLRQATGKTEGVEDDLVKMVYDEFQNSKQQTDLEDVAKCVINQICQQHQSCFVNSNYRNTSCRQIEDITLLIRDLTVGANSAPDTPIDLGLTKQLGKLVISVDDTDYGGTSEDHSPAFQHTRVDNDKTIIRPGLIGASISQTNLLDDNGQNNEDDEAEIDAYVDFTDLLKAYHEVPVSN